MINVDIRALALSEATNVWRLFPGKSYSLLPGFIEQGTAFLDLPSLTFSEGPLVRSPDLFERMLAAMRTKELIAQGGVEVKAVTDFDQFKGSRRTKHRGRMENAIVNFYAEAKTGDYIIVPDTLSQRRVYLGVFSDNQITEEFSRYGDHAIPGRNIEWLSNVDEGTLSSPLVSSLRQQHPFSLIEKSRYVEVFALANGSYTYQDRSVATIYNRLNDFIDADSALLGVLSKLAAAACESIHNGVALDDNTLKNIISASSIEFTCTQESDIHSPGFTRLISAARTPLVVAAVLAVLLVLGADAPIQDMQQVVDSITITNSLGNDDECIAVVSEATKMILNSAGIETTYEFCRAATEAAERAGLEPSAVAQPMPEFPE